MSVALVNQHAKRMGRFILSSVACSVLQYFILSDERNEFRKKYIEHRIYFFLFSSQLLSKTFLTPQKNSSIYYHNCILNFL